MKRIITSLMMFGFLILNGLGVAQAEDDSFVPAYENEESYKVPDPNEYIAYEDGRMYYTSGKEDGFRVNENNEESTDETIGILTFPLALATMLYMNFIGWWY